METRTLLDADYYDEVVYGVVDEEKCLLSEFPSFMDAVDEMKRLKGQYKKMSIILIKKSVTTNYFIIDDLKDFIFSYGGKINE